MGKSRSVLEMTLHLNLVEALAAAWGTTMLAIAILAAAYVSLSYETDISTLTLQEALQHAPFPP
jgi:hypothetical protein